MKASLKEMSRTSFRKRKKIKKEIKTLKASNDIVKAYIGKEDQIMDWKDVVHVALLSTASEGAEIIEPSIQAIADGNFPNKQIIILLATEEREPEEKRLEKVEILKNKFEGVFMDFIVTTHEVADGEMKCKASNATYAAKRLRTYLDEKNIDYKRVILSNLDCDTICHKEYFAGIRSWEIIHLPY